MTKAQTFRWNNKELRDSFCPAFIRFSVLSWRGGAFKNGGKKKEEECAYGAVDKVLSAF